MALTANDNQPQRMRSIRVLGDENVLPGPRKTIHQRNKSSPALSTAAAIGGLKIAAKRTVFGDVSNTSHGTRLSKDDCAVAVKEITAPLEKASVISQEKKAPVVLQEKKAPVLSKPAQRPITVASLKNILTGSSASAASENISKRTSTIEPDNPNQIANTRKTLTKRSTTIFKNSSLPTSGETHHDTSAAPRAPIHQILNPIPKADVPPEPEKNRNPSIQIPIAELTVEESGGLKKAQLNSQNHEELKTEGFKPGEYRSVYAQPHPMSSLPQLHQPPIRSTDLIGSIMPSHPNLSIDTNHSGQIPSIDAVPSCYSQIIPSEPEEYWDDEDDDNYAEEGFVTARSYRSRGENTTGAATTVLFPQCTKSVQKELAAVKHLVESTRTKEDWEDEAFDTSMVAEYGDEIFTYMRELEVGLPNRLKRQFWSLTAFAGQNASKCTLHG